MSTNYFAKHIGLLRGENLYQIKRGNNKIGIDVARRINLKFPECSIPWLMFGIDDVDGIPGVLRVPYYNSVWSIDCPMKKRPERELVISEMVANGAQVAAYFEGNNTMSEKYLQHTCRLHWGCPARSTRCRCPANRNKVPLRRWDTDLRNGFRFRRLLCHARSQIACQHIISS